MRAGWMTKVMRWLATELATKLTRVALLGGLLGAAAATGAHAQAPLTLWNGTSLEGWTAKGAWTATGGNLTTTGDGDRTVLTAVPFGEMRLSLEYNETAPMGAKLRLWTTREGTGGLLVDLDGSGAPAGMGGIEVLTHSAMNATPGGWHRVEVEARDGQVTVRVDGQAVGTATGVGARAGYLGFEATGSGGLEVKNVRLLPLGMKEIFNGTDLSGWKSVAQSPDAKAGMEHTVEKTLTFGIGGGSTKAHEAKWTVRGGAIHGESGPGGLESGTAVEDGIFEIAATAKGEVKPDSPLTLAVRDPQGRLGGGYLIGVGPNAGSVEHLVAKPMVKGGTADETVVIAGRTIAVWINGTLATLHTDTRPEASDTAQGAKTGGGTVALLLPPHGGAEMDVTRLKMASLGRSYGTPARQAAVQPPAPPTPVLTPQPAAATPAPPSDAEKALLEQQQLTAKKQADDAAKQQQVAGLMGQALAATDAQQQMSLYGQVVQLDPANAAAVEGYKEAQGKLQAQAAAEQQAATAQVNQQHVEATRDEQTRGSLGRAQSAFLAGKLGEASSALAVAERLSPNNPVVRDLRLRISSAQAVRSRLLFLGGGMGLLATAGLVAAWLRRRKQQRFPVLEMTRGFEEGRLFPIEKDLVRIGAVAQNGSQKNDIVIEDVEHAISRFHCEVARKNGQLFVTDLKSSNGTRLDGTALKPGQPEPMRRGSVITLANNVDLKLGYGRRPKAGRA